jgi:hypothetical protein
LPDVDIGSGLFWSWGWLAGVGIIIMLGVFLLPWFFFLLNLQTLLTNVSPENRRMSPGLVWLNFIPVFQLGWFIYTVVKVKDSLTAEFRSRGWFIDGDLGYNVGLTAGILWVASFVIGWIPFIGWVLPLAGIICWILYWLKTSDLRNRLDAGPAWHRGQYQPMYPPAYPPYGGRNPQGAPRTAAPPPGEGAEPGEDGAKQAEPSEDTTGETEARDYRCAACGAEFDPGDWFCRKCGSRLY